MRILATLVTGLYLVLQGTGHAAFYDENSLNKLFTEPSQRQKIDAFRKGKSLGATREQTSPTDVKVQGIVSRSDGKSTVWVNGKSTLDGNSVGGVNVNTRSVSRKSDRVAVSVNNKTVRLKPGQVWSEDTGQVTDSY